MELSKRKSLLTPAAPTVWGMIYGDISKQKDIVEKIDAAVKSELEDFEVDVDLSDYYTKSEIDAALENIDVDLTGYATEDWVNENLQTKADKSNTYTKTEVDDLIGNINIDTSELATKEELQVVATSVENGVAELRGYVDDQIGVINIITEDILA